MNSNAIYAWYTCTCIKPHREPQTTKVKPVKNA